MTPEIQETTGTETDPEEMETENDIVTEIGTGIGTGREAEIAGLKEAGAGKEREEAVNGDAAAAGWTFLPCPLQTV